VANADYNGASQDGVGYFQRYIEGGRRVSCADAFLHPAVRRGGIDLRVGAHADAVLFEGTRACGVHCARGGAAHTVPARREVIVCAGTLNSPTGCGCPAAGVALRAVSARPVQHQGES
jgi:choline dehydrogenase